MVFSSVSFLYFFLPLLFIIYFSVPVKYKNAVLFGFSLLFYFYGEPVYTVLLLFSSLSGYVHGLLIGRYRGEVLGKVFLISSIALSLGALGFFKYSDFFIENVNALFEADIRLLGLVLPLGISFYTLQILSYTIDVYRGEVGVQRNALDFFMYVALFPQLIAGPIVRYEQIEDQLRGRTHSFENTYKGVRLFIFGLAKKVLIANTLAEIGMHFQNAGSQTVLFHWLMAIAFTFQIYYDFSGYSDMARGLGRMFGFRFPKNFNYPYISSSVTEFWRRWHMTLGEWFRRYVYIPLGGNRVTLKRLVVNLLIVWFLTGFWHGAAWNFVVWGLMYGVLLIVEKVVLKDRYQKIPIMIRHVYVMSVVIIGFVLFNADSLNEGLANIKGLFAWRVLPLVDTASLYYLSSYAVLLIIAAIGSTPLFRRIVERIKRSQGDKVWFTVAESAFYMVLILMVTGFLVDGSFNPFIYFRF